MPKINVNGITREMNETELAQWEQMMAEMPAPEPTAEDRMNEIEAALIEQAAMMSGGK